jgi:hypothetical protein
MKNTLFFTLLIFFNVVAQAKTVVIHSDRNDAGEAVKKVYTLSPSRQLMVHLRDSPDHAGRNRLGLKLRCGAVGPIHRVQGLDNVCGLMSVDYDEVTDLLTLNLTKPNYASVAGDCSGEGYKETISLKGICPPPKPSQKSSAAEAPVSSDAPAATGVHE